MLSDNNSVFGHKAADRVHERSAQDQACNKVCECHTMGRLDVERQESRVVGARNCAWAIVENHHLERSFKFSNLAAVPHFVNVVGAITEEEWCHPNPKFGLPRAKRDLKAKSMVS